MASAAIDLDYLSVQPPSEARRATPRVQRPQAAALSTGDIWAVRDQAAATGVAALSQAELVVHERNAAPQTSANWLNSGIRRINRLLALSENWDSYGAAPVHPKAAFVGFAVLRVAAAQHLAEPTVVPTTGGGIQLEWHLPNYDLELQIRPDGLDVSAVEEVANIETEAKLSANPRLVVEVFSRLSTQGPPSP